MKKDVDIRITCSARLCIFNEYPICNLLHPPFSIQNPNIDEGGFCRYLKEKEFKPPKRYEKRAVEGWK